MEFRYNKLTVKGHHNIIFQDVNGEVVRETVEQFILKFTAEKDEQIRSLQRALFDRQQLERLGDEEIRALNHQLEQLLKEKEALEDQVGGMVDGLTIKDISKSGVVYQQAFSLFLQARLDDALALMNDKLLDAERLHLQSHQDKVSQARQNLADTLVLKGEIYEVKLQYDDAAKCYHDAIGVMPAVKYFRKLGQFYEKQLYYEKAETYYEICVIRAQVSQTKAICLGNLGQVQQKQNKIKTAEANLREGLALWQTLYFHDKKFLKQTVTAANKLALLLVDKQELTEAESLCSEGLALIHRSTDVVADDELAQLAMLYNCQGLIYEKHMEYEKAESSLQQSAAFRRRLADKNPKAYLPSLATAVANLATLQRQNKKFTAAEECYGEVIAIRRQLATQNPISYLPNLAISLGNRANLYIQTTEFGKAETDYLEALDIHKQLLRIYPKAFREQGTVILNNLAHLYTRQTRIAQAEHYYQMSVLVLRELAREFPEKHRPGLIRVLINMGRLAVQKGNFDTATDFYQESMQLARDVENDSPGLLEPEIATILLAKGNLAYKRLDFATAHQLLAESIALYRGIFLKNPQQSKSDLAFALQTTAMHHIAQGNFQEAENSLSDALNNCGLQNSEDKTVLQVYAVVLTRSGYMETARANYDLAQEHYEKVLAIRRELYSRSPDSYRTSLVYILMNFAYLKLEQQALKAALELYREADELMKQINLNAEGAYLPETATIANNKARLYCEISEYSEAEVLYEQALRIRRGLAQKYPQTYLPELGETLAQQAVLYYHYLPDRVMALQTAREAVSILKQFSYILPLASRNLQKALAVIDLLNC